MVTPAHDVNDTRKLQATFKDVNGVAQDPTTVTFNMVEPDGAATPYVYGTDAELVRESAGVYYVNWSITQPGRHTWSMKGTGLVAQEEEHEFYAKRSNA